MKKSSDWAERKAVALQTKLAGSGRLLIPEVADLLRAERRRAVRIVRMLKRNYKANEVPNLYHDSYWKACDDCAAAIGGK